MEYKASPQKIGKIGVLASKSDHFHIFWDTLMLVAPILSYWCDQSPSFIASKWFTMSTIKASIDNPDKPGESSERNITGLCIVFYGDASLTAERASSTLINYLTFLGLTFFPFNLILCPEGTHKFGQMHIKAATL